MLCHNEEGVVIFQESNVRCSREVRGLLSVGFGVGGPGDAVGCRTTFQTGHFVIVLGVVEGFYFPFERLDTLVCGFDFTEDILGSEFQWWTTVGKGGS
jgi:hypothetical protein